MNKSQEERIHMSVARTGNSNSNTETTAVGGIPVVNSQHTTVVHTMSPARKSWVENISILLKYKWLILGTSLFATVIAGVYCFTMPNYYKATAVVLPARKTGGVLDNVTSGLAGSLKDLGVAKLGGSDESYTPLSLMTSRQLQRGLTKQFDFQKLYKDSILEDATDEFSEHLSGDVSPEGNFTISFEDTNPLRAANVANAVVDSLNEVNSRLAKDEARHNFAYVEARYNRNAADLDSAERALGEFQHKYGVFSLPEQAKAELTAVAEAEQQRSAAEIQLQNAEQIYGANSSEATIARNTIEQLSGKIGQMQAGMDSKASSFVPTNVMPEVALDYLRRMRDVEIQSKLKAFVLPAYEQGKLDMNKVLYGFVTLDHATPPVHKSKPHRSIILIAVLASTFILSCSIVIVTSHLDRARRSLVQDRLTLGV